MDLRLIPRLEQDSRLVAACQRPAGRWALLAAFALLSAFFTGRWLAVTAFLVATTAFPSHRRRVVSAAGILLAIALPDWLDLPFLGRLAAQEGLARVPPFFIRLVIAAVFVLLAGLAALAFRFPRSLPARRPVLASILSFCVLFAGVSMAPLSGWSRIAGWIAVLAIGHMLWFFCYTLSDRNSRNRDSVPLQAGLWPPPWMANMGYGAPVVKGAAYLRRIEAHSAEELAVTQIKGVKLLIWAMFLQAVLVWFQLAVHGKLAIPELQTALARSAAGRPFPWHWNCLSLAASFVSSLLQVSVWGHQIVACARMAGFRALRNTFRPLESRTVAEFWNRFSYYFKELLLEMFFYPTYLRYFKNYPRLRMAAATMMAACAGNAIFHFLRDPYLVGELGWRHAIGGFETYLFCTFVLGAGISVSQLRARRRIDESRSWLRRRAVPFLCVSGFYCLLHVFDDTERILSLREHFQFVGRLFGF